MIMKNHTATKKSIKCGKEIQLQQTLTYQS